MAAGSTTAESLALSIHGPAGVLDLVVPPGATAADVAAEYAVQTGGPGDPRDPGGPVAAGVPVLHRRLGVPLDPDRPLGDAGVRTGEVLVAARTTGLPPGRRARGLPASDAPSAANVASAPGGGQGPGALSALWCGLAGAVALLAGWSAARGSGADRDAVLALLVAATVLGVLPVGRLAGHRVLAAPAFAGAAAYALVWDGVPERLPMTVGIAALAAAVAAAVGRALDLRAEEALRVWCLAGGAVFAVTGLTTLAGTDPQVAWAVLLLLATLMPRFVPGLAIDVPDQYLLDLERLAVTAWSAREQPRRRRGRVVVPPEAVELVASRGARLVTASSAAVLAVVVVSAPLLLATATLEIDRAGARVLVGLCGAALLLAARNHRHAGARAMLRLAGLAAWTSLAAVLLAGPGADLVTPIAALAIGLAVVLVAVAVATGRGWRSAWWARRAELAEGLAGSFAIAALLVATGLFRSLWELTS